ncbi:hypothetical protein, partial [Idiomarina xiamenensis]
MPHSVDNTRRRLLTWLAGAPLLPLAANMSASLWSSLASAADAKRRLESIQFIPMPAPTLDNPAEMATTLVKSALHMRYDDGSSEQVKLAYEPFFITGDSVPDGKGGSIVAGGYFNIHQQPILDPSANNRQFFSNCPDGSSLLTVAGAQV